MYEKYYKPVTFNKENTHHSLKGQKMIQNHLQINQQKKIPDLSNTKEYYLI